jgi:hypothetical protein
VEVGLRLDGQGIDFARVAVVSGFEESDVESHDKSPFRFKTTPCGLLYGPFAEVCHAVKKSFGLE